MDLGMNLVMDLVMAQAQAMAKEMTKEVAKTAMDLRMTTTEEINMDSQPKTLQMPKNAAKIMSLPETRNIVKK